MTGVKSFFKKNAAGYIFMLPFVILFCAFTLVAVVIGFAYSITNYNMIESPIIVWFDNFKNLIMNDDEFIIALKNTLVFALISGPAGFILSFVMAWIINNVKLRNVYSLCFYAPSITSGVAITVIWLYFFAPDRYGLINNLLINLGIINSPVLWNMNPETIMPIIILITLWMSMGAGFLTFLAGLQGLPTETFEAGKIDGVSNSFQELFYLTLPQMKPQLLFGSINAIVGAFSVFDIAVTFAGMPSPNYAAHTIVAHLYDYAFIRFEMGYASAVAVILFLITFFLGRLCIRLFSSKDE